MLTKNVFQILSSCGTKKSLKALTSGVEQVAGLCLSSNRDQSDQ